jgi:DNA helicase IV
LSSSTDERRVDEEQQYLSMLYGRIDAQRGHALARLADLLRETGGTPQARSERDSSVGMYQDKLAQLNAVEAGLCFGRLDFDDDERFYIGRIGLFDDDGDYEPLLIDWRAPAARPFYLATAASPLRVRRRRHIRTSDRRVLNVDDEVLDLDAARDVASADHGGLAGEATLLAAVTAGRTGRMKDIVETIQAEQDRVIRADLHGVLVVAGGPGTGKTAVALHRAAYLLYTHRAALSQRGVLIVGPNTTFLRYISQVLPSLAETGVVLCTPGELYPTVVARDDEPAEAAEIKGRLAMVDVLAAAIRDRQRVPDVAVEVPFDGDVLRIDRRLCIAARDHARRSRRPHNLARPLFVSHLVAALTDQVAQRIGTDPYGGENLLDESDLADIRRELAQHTGIRAALAWMWPRLTPVDLLADLFASAERIASATPDLSEAQRRLLLRAPARSSADRPQWTPADVPLLDEAAELLGEEPEVDVDRSESQRLARIEYAEGVLDIAVGSRSVDTEDEDDPELLTMGDVLSAGHLAQRQEHAERLTVAQRAAADRTWAYGHIIVDEAQELSAMAWRLLMRRSPSRSMTVVGDVAQTGDLGGAVSWPQVLTPYVANRWRMAELTVNYRTPAEIMAVAADVLRGISPDAVPPRSVRESGIAPWLAVVTAEALIDTLIDRVRVETSTEDDGRLGVIVPASEVELIGSAVTAAFPEVAVGDDPDLLCRVAVLTVRQAKGLEFDAAIVVNPGRLVAESPRGLNDLYVALTRATRRLGVLTCDEVPDVLSGLSPIDSPI